MILSHIHLCCVCAQDWDKPELVPLGTKYTTALYTVFNALEGAGTDNEKLYAVRASSAHCVLYLACASSAPGYYGDDGTVYFRGAGLF
jgi:hypothetical protein